MNSPCTHNVTPADTERLYALVDHGLPDGAVLCLGPGVYKTTLWIKRPLTIRGSARDQVIIDAGHRHATITIANPDISVTLESLTLKNGLGGQSIGGNLAVADAKTVVVRDVALIGGEAEAGGGAQISDGEVTFEHCLMSGNNAKLGSALFVYETAIVHLRDCVIVDNVDAAPAVTASYEAQISLEKCTVSNKGGAALRAVNTGQQAPTIRATHCILGDDPIDVRADPNGPTPKVVLDHCALAAAPDGAGVVSRANIIGPVKLDANHRPVAGSPAAGLGADWK